MVIDQMQSIYAYYSFKNPDANDAASQASAKFYSGTARELTFTEELDHANSFLMVHPSQELHARPMFACDVQLSFFNQSSMEERLPLSTLRETLE